MTPRCIIFGAIAASLLLIEVVLRVYFGFGGPPIARQDPEIEYILVPGSYRRFGNDIQINSHGLRAPEFDDRAPATERRILLIGDSVIYGNHFLDQKETIAVQMTDMLTGPARDGGRTLVIPVALSSWGPINQAAYIARHGTFGADMAIIVLSSHDLHDIPTNSRNLVPYRLWRPLGAIDDAVHSVLERFAIPPPASAVPMTLEEGAALSLAALDRMIAQMRTQGLQITLLYHPTISERQGGASTSLKAFADTAARTGVLFRDLHDLHLGPAQYRDDIHPNADGTERIARELARLVTTIRQ